MVGFGIFLIIAGLLIGFCGILFVSYHNMFRGIIPASIIILAGVLFVKSPENTDPIKTLEKENQELKIEIQKKKNKLNTFKHIQKLKEENNKLKDSLINLGIK